MERNPDVIMPAEAVTIPGLFETRVQKDPDKVAYVQFDGKDETWKERTWSSMHREVSCWQEALKREGLSPGDRVGIMVRNSWEWVLLDISALSSGLVVVPIFIKESMENIAHMIGDAKVKLLVIEDMETWKILEPIHDRIPSISRVILIRSYGEEIEDDRLKFYEDWFCTGEDKIEMVHVSPDMPATIVYTSGTTGLPRGVVLTHRNILWNAYAGLKTTTIDQNSIFLSFLPLTHMFERTVGYYLPMMAGATVCYARNVRTVAEDLITRKPTHLIAVPLVFQRIHEKVMEEVSNMSPIKRWIFHSAIKIGYEVFLKKQGRGGFSPFHIFHPILQQLVGKKVMARLGGRLQLVVSGGAALPFEIWKLFVSLGLNLIQGYGMTETSPVISVNRTWDNRGETVGPLLDDVEVKLGEGDEIIVKSPGVMKEYWNNPTATKAILEPDGWLHTGDAGEFIDGHLKITGRIKQIIVMANGEKVPPVRVEMKIQETGLFENVMIIGEGHPYLILLAVPDEDRIAAYAREHHMDPLAKDGFALLKTRMIDDINRRLVSFPAYVRIKELILTDEVWTPENGMLTSSLKKKRSSIQKRYLQTIEKTFREVDEKLHSGAH